MSEAEEESARKNRGGQWMGRTASASMSQMELSREIRCFSPKALALVRSGT